MCPPLSVLRQARSRLLNSQRELNIQFSKTIVKLRLELWNTKNNELRFVTNLSPKVTILTHLRSAVRNGRCWSRQDFAIAAKWFSAKTASVSQSRKIKEERTNFKYIIFYLTKRGQEKEQEKWRETVPLSKIFILFHPELCFLRTIKH